VFGIRAEPKRGRLRRAVYLWNIKVHFAGII
jgi:hypothetical protein